MALETEVNSNDCLLTGEVLLGSSKIVLLNDPLMIFMEDRVPNDCTFVLDPIYNENTVNQNLNFQEFVFDSNYYEQETDNCINVNSDSAENDGSSSPYHASENTVQCETDMLEMLYNNIPADQPEFVDVKTLTGTDIFEDSNSPSKNCITISDEEDDVIFVGVYKKNGKEEPVTNFTRNSLTKSTTVRRNPVRKARSTKASNDFAKELLFEEELTFLDHSDEENMVFTKKSSSSSDESFKQWPINVHERPEYNTITKKLENFDYTVREIQNSVPKKKPRLETVLVRRKPKKKYFARKNKCLRIVEKKIPIEELDSVVSCTYELMKDYLRNSEEYLKILNSNPSNIDRSNCDIKSNKYELVQSQITLISIVKNFKSDEILKKMEELTLINMIKDQ